MAHQRADEVKVGILVIVSALLLFLTVIAVGSYSPFRTRQDRYKARFSYVGGLAQGSTVRFGGLTVGRVSSVRVVEDGGTTIEVELGVNPGTPIRRDSEASVTSLGLLGDNYVEISLGTASAELLPPGEYLKQRQFPALPEIFAKVDSAVVDAQKLINNVNGQLTRIADRADTLLSDIDKVFDTTNRQKIASMLDETDRAIKEASPKIDATLTNIQKASGRIDPIMERVDSSVKRVRELVDNVDATVTENRPELRRSIQDLDQALLEARATIADVRSALNYNRGHIDLIIENMAASSDNIREFTDTVKQYPFSLVRTPSFKPRIPPEIRK